MTRWAGALATELVVKEDRTWVIAMTGRLPNPIFEGDFHPMPSGWAETKLSSRHGDEEHAVVPQPAAPFIAQPEVKVLVC